jgi:HD-GYP domain-containing protein (c-di-GMP phosphodiesterase class II)
LAERALQAAGAPAEERRTARLAGLLHDLGRAAVPNGIWDKPGRFGPLERERAQEHVRHSERVLARSPLLAPLAAIVAGHHERLDATGYPRGIPGPSGRMARVLAAADVFSALTEDRAHRVALAPEPAARALADEAAAGRLDREAVGHVLEAAGQRAPRLRGELPAGLSDREVEVLRLLARGLSNKEIGQQLFIAPKTVGRHVENIYAKTGVKTRAAAALYAVQHELIPRLV